MKTQEFEINSFWQQETGYWSEKENKYLNRTFGPIKEKKLKVIYEPEKDIIKFIGGPTGFESYYFSDVSKTVLLHPNHDMFCICGGTINRWPNCTIKREDFKKIINVILDEKN